MAVTERSTLVGPGWRNWENGHRVVAIPPKKGSICFDPKPGLVRDFA